MISKAVEAITKADVDALLTNQVAEGKTIDYKLTLPGGKDDDKKEFLADVSSFANAAGGDLVFGVSEDAGIPTGLPGLAVADLDAEILRLENTIRDGIEPRLPGLQLRRIEGFSSGPVLILRVPQSWASPHMVTFKNSSRFFTRSSAGKFQMDVGEIRSAFAASESLGERLQRFRTERLSKIFANETPVLMEPTAKMVLHILPLSSFVLRSHVDPKLLRNLQLKMRPPGPGGWDSRHNFDGIVTFTGSARHGESSGGYCQFFRSGAVEAVSADVFYSQGNHRFLAGEAYEGYLIQGLQGYMQGLKEAQVPMPVSVTLSMTSVRNVHLGTGQRMIRFQSTPIDRDVLLLPDVMAEQYDVDIPRLLRPIFDAVWNAAGYERSFNYDKDGDWKPQK